MEKSADLKKLMLLSKATLAIAVIDGKASNKIIQPHPENHEHFNLINRITFHFYTL